MPRWRSVTVSAFLALSVAAASGCVTGGAAPLDEDYYGDAPGELACVHNIEDYMMADTGQDSPTDLACHADCYRPCGFNASPRYPRGIKYCECESGVYIECRCPRAPWYKGAPDAPYCDRYTSDGLGLASPLDGVPCTTEWAQCVGRDVVDGYTPRGCVCLDRRTPEGQPSVPANFQWRCGSTEKWFYPEQSTKP